MLSLLVLIIIWGFYVLKWRLIAGLQQFWQSVFFCLHWHSTWVSSGVLRYSKWDRRGLDRKREPRVSNRAPCPRYHWGGRLSYCINYFSTIFSSHNLTCFFFVFLRHSVFILHSGAPSCLYASSLYGRFASTVCISTCVLSLIAHSINK